MSLIYKNAWTRGNSDYSMAPYAHNVSGGPEYWARVNNPDFGSDFPTDATDPADPVYPEGISSEAVKVTTGTGPSGENCLDGAAEVEGGSYADALAFGGWVGADFPPAISGGGNGCTLTSPTIVDALDPPPYQDTARWWDATKGRAKIQAKFVPEADNNGSLAFNVKINIFQNSGGINLGFFPDGVNSVWELDIHDGQSGGPGYIHIFTDDIGKPWTRAFNYADLVNLWHQVEYRWRCGTITDTSSQSTAHDGLIAVFSGSGSVQVTADAAGPAGNNFTFQIAPGVGNNLPLIVTLTSGVDYLISLGTNGSGAQDDTKNSVTLVAAAINALAGGVTATTTGSGAAAFRNARAKNNLPGGGYFAGGIAADGYITVFFDGEVLFDLQNIALVLNRYVSTPNWLREFWVGYFGLIGPSTNVEIYDVDTTVVAPTTPPPTLINSQPCCGAKPGKVSAGPMAKALDPTWTPSCPGGGAVPLSSDLKLSELWDY